MTDSKDLKAVGKRARAEREPHAEVERLRAAYQVAAFLMQAESRPAVRAWFLMNPGSTIARRRW
jgi:hypothetical protein